MDASDRPLQEISIDIKFVIRRLSILSLPMDYDQQNSARHCADPGMGLPPGMPAQGSVRGVGAVNQAMSSPARG
jgi:hypothetical protein